MNRYRFLPTYKYYKAEGYPLSLGKTAGKPLRNYRIYGNTIDGVGVGVSGKNVFDSDRWYNELYKTETSHTGNLIVTKGDDGIYKYVQTSAASGKGTLKFMEGEFKENTRYTFSFMGKFISGSGNAGITLYCIDGEGSTKNITVWVGSTMTTWTPRNITTPANTTLLYMSINTYSPASIFQLSNIQLEEGTTVTAYEPYKVSLPILLDGQEVANIPLDHPLQDGEYIDYKADNLPVIPTKKHQPNLITVQSNVPPSKIWCECYK